MCFRSSTFGKGTFASDIFFLPSNLFWDEHGFFRINIILKFAEIFEVLTPPGVSKSIQYIFLWILDLKPQFTSLSAQKYTNLLVHTLNFQRTLSQVGKVGLKVLSNKNRGVSEIMSVCLSSQQIFCCQFLRKPSREGHKTIFLRLNNIQRIVQSILSSYWPSYDSPF